MNREYVENLINDLKAIEFGKDYIINGNELYELKDYLINIHKQIDQLTNNWNELEEWVKSYISLIENPDTLEEQTLEDLQEVLDKMKEIKEGKNEPK